MKITKSELREIIQEVVTEMGLFEGLTAAQEKLPEPLKKAILKKQGNSDDSSDEEDVEESIEEGNAFGAAVKAARDNGDSEFQVGGKTYQLKEKVTEEVEDTEEFTGEDEDELEEGVCETCDEDDEEVEEGNAFGDAVAKAKESGETEFEVGGKTYKVRENWSKITLSEKLNRMLGNREVL